MATRLTAAMKKRLRQAVYKRVDDPELGAVKEAKFQALLDFVLAALVKKFPTSDMEVLGKYDLVSSLDGRTVYFSGGWGNSIELPALPAFQHTLAPERIRIDFTEARDPECYAAYMDYCAAADAYKESSDIIKSAYFTLITKSKTLEALAEKWKEAPDILQTKPAEELDLEAAADLVVANQCMRKVMDCDND